MRADAAGERAAGPDRGRGRDSAGGGVLVVGMGNVLRGDDGFGVRVLEALEESGVPDGVTTAEVGTGGIHLVQELMAGYAALVLVDAVDRKEEPGTVFVLRPEVPEASELSDDERRSVLADTHYAVPAKAMLVAKSLDVLPDRTYIVGCQPDGDDLSLELSGVVSEAVDEACRRVRELIEALTPAEEAP